MQRKALATAVFATFLLPITAVHAQLEEVVVTAQKREQSLQDVPISITAIGGDRIQDAAINSFNDLDSYVPNFGVSENAIATSISMRGISVGANQSFEQSVGTFVDGIYLGRMRQIRLGFFDLAQIEVLRGPQSVLFGKNTLAGAVNIRSASPDVGGETSGRFAMSHESNDGQVYEGYLQGSLSDTFAVRIAARERSDEGYLDNKYADEFPAAFDTAPQSEEQIFRISTRWEAGENTQVDMKYLYSDHERVGATSFITLFQPTANLAPLDQAGYALNGALFPNAPLGQYYRAGYSIGGAALSGRQLDVGGPDERLEGTQTENEEWSMNITHEFDNDMSLTWTSGYSEYNFEDGLDADWGPLRFIGRSDDQQFDQSSHELRLAGGGDDLYWTVGLNYLESTQYINRLTVLDGTFGAPATVAAIFGAPTALAYSPAQLDNLLGPGVGINTPIPAFGGVSLANLGGYASVTPGMPGVTMFNQMGGMADWTQDTKSQAIFAQVSYDLSDTLNLTLGLRYTEEDKDVVAITDVTYDSTARAGAGLSEGGIATAVDYSGIGPGMNLGAFMGHSLLASLLGRYETDFNESRSTDQILPGVALSWTPDNDSSYYLTYSEGFKSGGFNAAIDQDPVFANVNGQRTALRNQPGIGFEFDDETGWSIELGGKHTLLDGDMTLNWNLFTSEYQDQQVSTFQGTGFVIANAGSSISNGFEMDMQWKLSDEFKVIAAVGLLDAEYDKFEGAACTALQQSAVQGLGALTSASPVTSADGCQQLFDATGAPAGQVQDISGAQLGAEYSGSIILEYTKPISQDMMWFTHFDANFTDGYFMTGDRDPIDYQDGFQLYNIRAGIRTENWMVMAYGRNIGDELYATGAADLPVARGSHFIYSGTTAVYGLTVSYEF